MKTFVSLITLCFFLCGVQLWAQDRKVVDPADIVNLTHVSDPQISPDGNYIAYVATGPDVSGAHIWLVRADGSAPAKPFILSGGSDISPRWSPNSESLAFLSDRANPLAKSGAFHFSMSGGKYEGQNIPQQEEYPDAVNEGNPMPSRQIWLISLAGGEAIPLTDVPGGIKSFKWSPDGKFLAYIRRDPYTAGELKEKQDKQDQILVNQNYKFDRLWIYELATGRARLITNADMNIDDFDWSPDGKRFLARVSPTTTYNDHWYVSKIVILDATTGAVEQALLTNAAYSSIHWSPDGNSVSFAKRGPHGISALPVLYNLNSGKETVVGSSYPATINNLQWAPDSKSLLGSAILDTSCVFLKVDANTGSVSKPSNASGPCEGFTISADGEKVAYLKETPQHPDEVYVRSHDEELRLTNTNPQVATWSLPTSQELAWKSSKDGMTIHGVLLLPPGYQEGKRYKTIVQVHGGPEEAWVLGFHGEWYDWFTVLASHGYVVLLPDPRGSDGQGPAFTAANYRDWGYGDFQDIMDGVDLLISKGIADPDRLGIGGWSYGGFMTGWTITHTDRFKVAIDGSGISDITSMAVTSDIAPSYFTEYFGELAENRKLYDEHSPVRFLENCHTPVLVMVGEADSRVPVSQSEEFYNGLHFLGREAEMVRYPREHHIFAEKAHQIDSLERMLHWYDSHLN